MKHLIIMTTTFLMGFIASAQDQQKDEKDIREIVMTIQNSWNRKDGKGFAEVFAETHDYIVVNGMYFSEMTREENAGAHQALFDGIYKKRDIHLLVDKVVFIRSDLAMIYVIGAGYDKGGDVPRDPTVIMSILVEKQSDGWKIIAFHNHGLDTNDLKQRSPLPLEAMYSSWYKK